MTDHVQQLYVQRTPGTATWEYRCPCGALSFGFDDELGALKAHDRHARGCVWCLWKALEDIAVEERPNHEHYEDPADCAHCRSYLLLGVETREEQAHG